MPPQAPIQRPLSPHLSIYKPVLTMMMSIVHRVTGAALYVGTIMVVWWLMAAATGPAAYADFQWFAGSIIGRVVLFGYTWALLHHALGGVRHLVWDMGYGFGPSEREFMARATIIGSIALTVLVWIIGFFSIGGMR